MNKQELKENQEKVLSGRVLCLPGLSLHLQIESLVNQSSLLSSLKLKTLGTKAVV